MYPMGTEKTRSMVTQIQNDIDISGSSVAPRIPSNMYITGLHRFKYAMKGDILNITFQVKLNPPRVNSGWIIPLQMSSICMIDFVMAMIKSEKNPANKELENIIIKNFSKLKCGKCK